MEYYLQGLSIGLAYVAPIGLQNLFVINYALSNPFYKAFIALIFIVFFDVLLSMACFFGIGLLIQDNKILQMCILLPGSLVMLRIGFGLIRAQVSSLTNNISKMSLLKLIGTIFFVTWINPQAIIDGTFMLGAFYATLPKDCIYAFILGVASASCLWFTGLTTTVSLIGTRINERIIAVLNKICGVVIIGYAITLCIKFVKMVLLYL